MSIICSICHDRITERPQSSEVLNPPDFAIVALRCGHLFHRSCTDQWFRHRHACPCCSKPVRIGSSRHVDIPLRIYPTCDDYNFEQQAERLKEATGEVDRLSQELSEMTAMKEHQLQIEVNAHDNLKVEHAKLLSNLDVHLEYNENVRRIIEKLDEEKEELRKNKMELEERELSLSLKVQRLESLLKSEWKSRKILELEVNDLKRRLTTTNNSDLGEAETGHAPTPVGVGSKDADIGDNGKKDAESEDEFSEAPESSTEETESAIGDPTFELALEHAKRSMSMMMGYVLAPYRQNASS